MPNDPVNPYVPRDHDSDMKVAYYTALTTEWFAARTQIDRSMFGGSWASLGAILAAALTQDKIPLWQGIFGGVAALSFAACLIISLRVHQLDSEYLMTLIQQCNSDDEADHEELEQRLNDLDFGLRSMFWIGLGFTFLAALITIIPKVHVPEE